MIRSDGLNLLQYYDVTTGNIPVPNSRGNRLDAINFNTVLTLYKIIAIRSKSYGWDRFKWFYCRINLYCLICNQWFRYKTMWFLTAVNRDPNLRVCLLRSKKKKEKYGNWSRNIFILNFSLNLLIDFQVFLLFPFLRPN
jgi:hypothetical protein